MVNDVGLEGVADVAGGGPCGVALEEFVIDDRSESRLINSRHCCSTARGDRLLYHPGGTFQNILPLSYPQIHPMSFGEKVQNKK